MSMLRAFSLRAHIALVVLLASVLPLAIFAASLAAGVVGTLVLWPRAGTTEDTP